MRGGGEVEAHLPDEASGDGRDQRRQLRRRHVGRGGGRAARRLGEQLLDAPLHQARALPGPCGQAARLLVLLMLLLLLPPPLLLCLCRRRATAVPGRLLGLLLLLLPGGREEGMQVLQGHLQRSRVMRMQRC